MDALECITFSPLFVTILLVELSEYISFNI